MADKYQTQCPHCGVKFQISAQQLQLANGNVRCGSCLQVFQASKNLVPMGGAAAAPTAGSARGSARPSAVVPAAPTATARPAAPPPAKPAAPAAAPPPPIRKTTPATPPPAESTLETDDDLADMILRELAEPSPAPVASTPRPPPAKPAAPPPPKPVAKAPVPPAEPPAEDDLADMILRELEEEAKAPPPPPPANKPRWDAPSAPGNAPQWAPQSQKPASPPPANRYGIEDNKTRIKIGKDSDEELIQDDPSDTFGDSRTGSPLVSADEDIFGGGQATMLDKIDEPIDEDWAKELMGEKVEDEKDKLIRQFTEFTADNMSLATTGVQHKSALQERLERANDATPAPLSRTASGDEGGEVDELDFLNDGALTMQDVELPGMDSVQIGDPGLGHQVEWGRQTFWGALCAVFALTLFAQYLVFNFDTLAREDSWRGVYDVACGAVGCELPPENDINRIQGANLVIRSHPRYSGALIVDAIVYNRAPFAQPFPDLELSFSDSSGAPMAGRVFKPSEYLKGEMAGAESMPPDTPVHLSLELVDPGEGAVNYELRFLPPASS